jgi:hypothetical protein
MPSWLPRATIYSLLVLAISAGVFADRLSGVWLAKKLRTHAELEPDIDRAVSSVKRLAQLEDSGWLQLVNLLEAPVERVWVADEARRQLVDKIESWRKLPSDRSAAKVQRLAARLRRVSEDWGDDTTVFAGRVAQTLLRWPIPPADRTDDLIADCEYLMHRAASVPKLDVETPEQDDGTEADGDASIVTAEVYPGVVSGAVADEVTLQARLSKTVATNSYHDRTRTGGIAKIAPSYSLANNPFRVEEPTDERGKDSNLASLKK